MLLLCPQKSAALSATTAAVVSREDMAQGAPVALLGLQL